MTFKNAKAYVKRKIIQNRRLNDNCLWLYLDVHIPFSILSENQINVRYTDLSVLFVQHMNEA